MSETSRVRVGGSRAEHKGEKSQVDLGIKRLFKRPDYMRTCFLGTGHRRLTYFEEIKSRTKNVKILELARPFGAVFSVG